MPVTLTKLESEILIHRLDVPDCICEVLGESAAGEDVDSPEWVNVKERISSEAAEAIEQLYPFVEAGKLPDTLTAMQVEVLTDCIDGSTWVGCMDGNCTEQLIGRHYAAGCRLQKKLEAAYGIKCDFPNH